MHHQPEPHYSFTVPSIHDDTALSCRIYHPDLLSSSSSGKAWRKKGIVMAHPYAPMGGSHDDRVVGIVVDEFLSLGYIIGTFNFRGAHGSKGRTSWSGKPELDDYISFAGFFACYLYSLQPFPTHDVNFVPEQSRDLLNGSTSTPQESAVLILGGYSYGSLILKHLPPLPSILQPFFDPIDGSAASEILLRAHKLSDQSNLDWINLARDQERQKLRGHEHKLSVTMGGQESSPELGRSSREIRRSLDAPHSLDLGNKLRNLNPRKRKDESPATITVPKQEASKAATSMPEVRYLLVSPLTPPISTLAAPGLVSKFWGKSQEYGEVIGKHISLAVYGDQDIFTSSKRLQQWAEKLSSEPGSRFSHIEIAGAGHFWVERGVEKQLRTVLTEWETDTWN